MLTTSVEAICLKFHFCRNNPQGDNTSIVPEFIDLTYPDVDGIPANILIESSNGIIIGRDLYGEELMDKLSELFLFF